MVIANINDSEDRRDALSSIVYERLRQDIITTAVEPGEKLHIRSLCDRFEVGLSPVREALSRLSTEGLVSKNDHRGFAVMPVSEADLVDLTSARCWLNEVAIRKSIERGDAAWEESVVLSFHRLSRTPRFASDNDSERSEAWEAAHRNFHTSLICASGSDRMIRYCEHLFDSAERYRHIGRRAGVKGSTRDVEHRELMEAVIARDGDRAAKLITLHFERTADRVRQVMSGK